MNNLLLYQEWGELFKALPDEKAGELIKALFAYQSDPDARPTDPYIVAIFMMFKATIDADREKYAAKCQKNRDAAKSRWHADGHDAPDETSDNADECERINKNADGDQRTETHYKSNSKSKSKSKSNKDSDYARAPARKARSGTSFSDQRTYDYKALEAKLL